MGVPWNDRGMIEWNRADGRFGACRIGLIANGSALPRLYQSDGYYRAICATGARTDKLYRSPVKILTYLLLLTSQSRDRVDRVRVVPSNAPLGRGIRFQNHSILVAQGFEPGFNTKSGDVLEL